MFSIFDVFHQAAAAAKADISVLNPIGTAQAAPVVGVVAEAALMGGKVLAAVAPRLIHPETWSAGLQKTADTYAINTPKRAAAFIAQVAVESGYFVFLSENLNYSAASLLSVFPSHFTADEADSYARKPEQIANRVYANRMGNGPESSGDGWAFHGRGLIQITGRYMYQSFATALKMSLADAAAYMETTEGACMSAGWFWNDHKLNALADTDQFTLMTMRINGGTNGLADRKAVWAKAQAALGI